MSRYKVIPTKTFIREYSKIRKNSPKWVIEEIIIALELLAEDGKLPENYHDHQLSNELSNEREFHVLDDLLIKYRIKHGELEITALRIGSHDEIF